MGLCEDLFLEITWFLQKKRLNLIEDWSKIWVKFVWCCFKLPKKPPFFAKSWLRACPHLHCGITSWGNSAFKYITKVQVQQNFIPKIMTKISFIKTKLSPIYRQLNFLNLSSIFELEVIKFVYKFKKKTLPILFYNYFRSASQTHSYPTRFALDLNWTVMCSKKTRT